MNSFNVPLNAVINGTEIGEKLSELHFNPRMCKVKLDCSSEPIFKQKVLVFFQEMLSLYERLCHNNFFRGY